MTWVLISFYCISAPGLVLATLSMRQAQQFELPHAWMTPFRLPLGATQYLESHPIPGQIFNELRQGGYLIWHFADPKFCFVDGRMVLRSAEQFSELLGVIDHPEAFAEFQSKHKITHVLLPLMEWDRYRPLAASLIKLGSMRLLYCDGASALLVETKLAIQLNYPEVNRESIAQAIHQNFGTNPKLAQLAETSAMDFMSEAELNPLP